MSRIKRAVDFFGLKRSMVGLLGMVVLVGMGEHMGEEFLPLYLIALGGGFISVGFLNAMDNLLGALYSFPGGYLSDRLGTKKALLIFNLLSMVGFAIVIAIPTWPAVIVGALFFLSWSAISLPATMGLVAQVLPKNKRTMGVSVHSLVRRLPKALGPLAGGVLVYFFGIKLGVRLAFAGALVLAIAAVLLQQWLIEDDDPKASRGKQAEGNPLKMWKFMSPGLKQLLVADILVRFCEQIPYAFVVIWTMEKIAHPVNAVQQGSLRTIEMMTAVLIYVPVAWLADRGRKKPFVVLTFCFFTAFPLVLLYCHSFWPLAAAFVLRGLKEFGEPTRKALIMDLAPEDKKASMFGLYYLVRDVIVSVAAFGGGFLWAISPRVNLLTAFGFGLLGTLWFALFGKDLGRAEPELQAA